MSFNSGIIRVRMARDSLNSILDGYITANLSGHDLEPGNALFSAETAEKNVREAILAFRAALTPPEAKP
jgi:hypothetical protein